MTALLVKAGPTDVLVAAEKLKAYIESAKSESTKQAYRHDWQDFLTWCERVGQQPMPAAPLTVAGYLADLAEDGKSASTIGRRTAAIRFAHRLAGYESPTNSPIVEAAAAGIRRHIGTAQQGKAPAVKAIVKEMVATLPDNLIGKRDRALLLLGFAGAFRRSELVALDLTDLQECPEGLRVIIRRSKTDQEGEGRTVGIPNTPSQDLCPVRAVKAWIEAAGFQEGALFRGMNRHGKIVSARLSGKAVADVVKRTATNAGYQSEIFSGHSLRAGLATSAAAVGVSERVIMQQTGHKSERMVRKYIREGNLFRENAAAIVLA